MTDFLTDALTLLAGESAPLLSRLAMCTEETAARMNITSRKTLCEIVFYHVADSLSLVGDVRGARRVCDVGTGGGFPGLVLAALCPDTQFTLMDATQKKVAAIAKTAETLGLKNVRALCARAEEAGRAAEREQYDVVVSRALAALPMLSELCLPLVRVGGKFVAMKGPRAAEELCEARPILAKFFVGEPVVRREVLSGADFLSLAHVPNEEERAALDSFCAMERLTLIFDKKRPTPPKYPRPFSKIARGGV